MKRYPLPLKALLLLVLSMFVSACAADQNYCWYNAKKTMQETRTDKFQCEEAAVAYSSDMDEAGNKNLINLRMIACMKDSKDYLLVLENTIPKDSVCVK